MADRVAASDTEQVGARTYAGTGPLSGRSTLERPTSVTTMTRSVVLPRPPHEVFEFCLRRDSFPAIMPDPVQVLWGSTEHGQLGGTYDFRWWFKGIVPIRWVAFVDSWEPGREFSDVQVRGMFRWFHHTHTCEPHPDGCQYTDTVTFRSVLGPRADRLVLLPQMQRMFGQRHDRMRRMLQVMP